MATRTATPLSMSSVTIWAVMHPNLVGLVVNVIVSEVALAAVTMPTAPLHYSILP